MGQMPISADELLNLIRTNQKRGFIAGVAFSVVANALIRKDARIKISFKKRTHVPDEN